MPGILLLFSEAFNRRSLTEFLVCVVGSSLSFFIVFPWLIRPLNISLLGFAYAVFIISAVILVAGRKKIWSVTSMPDKNELILLGVLLIVLVLRMMPVFFQIAPAGVDMSVHSYIARLICDNDGVLGLPSGAHPTGFPALSAIMSLLGGSPVYRSSLFMSCLAYALMTFGLYVFLLRFFERNAAAAAAIAATFLTINPQWMIGQGSSPTALALFLFLLALSLAIELKEGFSWPKATFALLALAAAMITQGINIPRIAGAGSVLYDLAAVALMILAVFASPAAAKKKLIAVFTAIGFLFYCVFYLYNSILMCPVTQADIDAFRWIDQTMGMKAVFINNYGDAGPWIPAITGRAITDPSGEAGLSRIKANYIYLGSKAVNNDIEFKKEDLQKNPWKYKLVYINDGAQVWKIL